MFKKTYRTDRIPESLLSALDRRDVALWVRNIPSELSDSPSMAQFLGLPWRLVLSEVYDAKLFDELESNTSFQDPMTRRRGFAQIIDTDPSRIELPSRCLPIYLLNGRGDQPDAPEFAKRLRRMTMLEELRRSGVRGLLVISVTDPVPSDLADLWTSDFRCHLIFASDAVGAEQKIADWLVEPNWNATYLTLSTTQAIESILDRYAETYPEERIVVRIRDVLGETHKIDLTEADDPERPILESYSLIEERDLLPLTPEDLSEEDFVGFFRNSTASWRPYAAGVPWFRDEHARRTFSGYLRKLDTVGPDENCIAYVSSESGAGGTTFARALAWEYAHEGYPVLLAKQLPFAPDALPIANFINRVRSLISAPTSNEGESHGEATDGGERQYETPWIIVFDTVHWQRRDNELVQFHNEMKRSGRPVCLLIVTDSILDPSFSNTSIFKRLTALNHAISVDEAGKLGHHLNKFLRLYGKQREPWQWEQFYKDHTVTESGTAAFWVALSFWIQGQYDLSETIQEWMYRSFKQNATSPDLKAALLRIAAMSAERLPLPEKLLPKASGEWPLSYALEDARSSLAALGLMRLSSDGEKYWALIHDILGRFLLNAVFYDGPGRQELGLETARDPDHLRFTLLREISREPLLGERNYRALGEDFATSIFKIDPDHGRSSFANIWRDVIDALTEMPRPLRDTSRLFRHHVAISRRRIAKLDERVYPITLEAKHKLLLDSVEDLKYALLHIEATPGSESDLNLLNSLALAYFDLADVEAAQGAPRERITEIRNLANEATRRAYDEHPTNSFVIETYVKNLLHEARENPMQTIEICVEILGIVFSALTSNPQAYRASQLSDLADQALNILLQQTSSKPRTDQPRSAIDVLVQAWQALAQSGTTTGMSLAEVPEENRLQALEILAHSVGRGNIQVIRLRYNLLSVTHPFDFKKQLELVEQLQATKATPQVRLEYAILLFQAGRAKEGDKEFRVLRHLWRESEHFVEVPERLRWLRGPDGKTLQTVKANVSSDYGARAMARVQALGAALVPFRPEEHGLRNPRVGIGFACHVSFGHNGPFLRPVTAGAHV